MSKAEGILIAVKFTDDLLGDVTGFTPSPVSFKYTKEGTWTAKDFYSGYPPTLVGDNDLMTYWVSQSSASWIRLQLAKAAIATKMKFYHHSVWTPKNFTVEGSNDGTNFTVLGTFVGAATSGWQEFTFTNNTSYLYYRLNYTSWNQAGQVAINDIQFNIGLGNEGAFAVTGQQYLHVNGPLIAGDYQIDTVTRHPTEPRTLLLTLKSLKRFNNVEGDLTITYDKSLGNLTSPGGVIESFSIAFTPTGLVKKINPWDRENLTVLLTPTFVVSQVNYKYGYTTERLTAQILPTITVTKVGSNPL